MEEYNKYTDNLIKKIL
ncbi:hypothetical protein [Candidatus Phytoplasma tritici]|nr:hypothetical protein [Candidatus Phytoplasma tritici]